MMSNRFKSNSSDCGSDFKSKIYFVFIIIFNIYNVGVCEQLMASMAAGLSKEG